MQAEGATRTRGGIGAALAIALAVFALALAASILTLAASASAASSAARPAPPARAGSAAAAAASSPAPPARACGKARIVTAVGPQRLYFRARRTPCGVARRVVRAYFGRTPAECVGSGCFIALPSGWRCHVEPGAVTQSSGAVAECSGDGGARRISTSRFADRGFELARDLGAALRLSPTGLGPLRLGISASGVERITGAPVSVEEGVGGCGFWSLPALGSKGQMIARDGHVFYIEVFHRGVATSRGIQVGDSLSRLRHRYRRALHPGRSASLGAAPPLFVTKIIGGTAFELQFEVDSGRVIDIAAATRHTLETFGECA